MSCRATSRARSTGWWRPRRRRREVNAALADAALKGRLTGDLGGTFLSLTPAEFGRLIADETEKRGEVVKAAGIKAE
jgi:hypothetical protein